MKSVKVFSLECFVVSLCPLSVQPLDISSTCSFFQYPSPPSCPPIVRDLVSLPLYSDYTTPYITKSTHSRLCQPIYCIYDRVCENQSYLHVKFDLILSLSNLITLFPNICSTLSKISSYTQNFLRNSIQLTDIVYPTQKRDRYNIMNRCILCR